MSTESTERIAALENDRDARIAALEARTSRELEDAALAAEAQTAASDERIATLEADLSATRAELSALSEAKTATDASNAAKVADLESRLADATTQRDEHAKNLSATRDRVAVLEAELASTRQELTETTQAHVTQKTRAEGAFTKWESDRASLERAKDALAVALAQIEEAETRPITGGSAG